MSMKVFFEIGHVAEEKLRATPEGYTHDWELFVRGADGADISHFVDKVVFTLHESFPRPKRVIKEPPFSVKEAGYAGFILPIEIYFKNRDDPKKAVYTYDIDLQPSKTQREECLIPNPSDEFRRKLLKGGGQLQNAGGLPYGTGGVGGSFGDYRNRHSNSVSGSTEKSGSSQEKKYKKSSGDDAKEHSAFTNLFGEPITKGNSSNSKVSPDHKQSAVSASGMSKTSPGTSGASANSSSGKGQPSVKGDRPSSGSSSKDKEKDKSSKHKYSSPNKESKESKKSSSSNVAGGGSSEKHNKDKRDKSHSKERDKVKDKITASSSSSSSIKRPVSPKRNSGPSSVNSSGNSSAVPSHTAPASLHPPAVPHASIGTKLETDSGAKSSSKHGGEKEKKSSKKEKKSYDKDKERQEKKERELLKVKEKTVEQHPQPLIEKSSVGKSGEVQKISGKGDTSGLRDVSKGGSSVHVKEKKISAEAGGAGGGSITNSGVGAKSENVVPVQGGGLSGGSTTVATVVQPSSTLSTVEQSKRPDRSEKDKDKDERKHKHKKKDKSRDKEKDRPSSKEKKDKKQKEKSVSGGVLGPNNTCSGTALVKNSYSTPTREVEIAVTGKSQKLQEAGKTASMGSEMRHTSLAQQQSQPVKSTSSNNLLGGLSPDDNSDDSEADSPPSMVNDKDSENSNSSIADILSVRPPSAASSSASSSRLQASERQPAQPTPPPAISVATVEPSPPGKAERYHHKNKKEKLKTAGTDKEATDPTKKRKRKNKDQEPEKTKEVELKDRQSQSPGSPTPSVTTMMEPPAKIPKKDEHHKQNDADATGNLNNNNNMKQVPTGEDTSGSSYYNNNNNATTASSMLSGGGNVTAGGSATVSNLSGDYMSELKDLQQKIMTLQDNNELQRVVEMIAATGCYEITSATFDFDLCALDRLTVQRLQEFFATSCSS